MSKLTIDIKLANEAELDSARERLGLSDDEVINFLIEYVFTNHEHDSFDLYAFSQLERREIEEEEQFDETTDLFRGVNEEETKTFEDVLDEIDSLGEKEWLTKPRPT